jgi:hypothetical protein
VFRDVERDFFKLLGAVIVTVAAIEAFRKPSGPLALGGLFFVRTPQAIASAVRGGPIVR